MSSTIQMYDSTEPAVLPAGGQAYAGYVGPAGPANRYVSFPGIVARFYPHAHLLSIAVHAYLLAACLDVETGDATPDQAPGWFHYARAHGQWKPCFYANASTMPAVRQALNGAGIPRSDYRLWVASWGNPPQIPAGYDAIQYADHGPNGENYDRSVVAPDFFGQHTIPPGGVANAALHFDLESERWGIRPEPGHVHFDTQHDRWASAEVQVNVHDGRWRVHPMKWNSKPLGGR